MKNFLDKKVTLGDYFFICYVIIVLGAITFYHEKMDKQKEQYENLEDAYFELREENWSLTQELHDVEEYQSIDQQWNEREAQQKEDNDVE